MEEDNGKEKEVENSKDERATGKEAKVGIDKGGGKSRTGIVLWERRKEISKEKEEKFREEYLGTIPDKRTGVEEFQRHIEFNRKQIAEALGVKKSLL